MPGSHLQAGLALASQTVPLDAEGRPSPSGKIALMSIRDVEHDLEYQTFMKLASGDKQINPNRVLVDGAQGGQSALETSDAKSNYWNVVDQRIAAAGVTAMQAQAVRMFQVRLPAVPARRAPAAKPNDRDAARGPGTIPEPENRLPLEPHLRGVCAGSAEP